VIISKSVLEAWTENTELDCYVEGDKVESDVTWWKLKGADECYIPNQVFEPTLFIGNAGKCQKK